MPIRLPDHRLTYFPVPKAACTTLKHVFHELRRGEPFEPFRRPNGRLVAHIHEMHPTPPFAELGLERYEDDIRIVVVRDPVRRFLSAYRNRVRYHWELSAEGPAGPALAERGLAPDPDLETFVQRLDDYREVSRPIRHHTEPQITFTGGSVAYYTRIFPMERLSELETFLGDIVGRSLTFPHLQTGGPQVGPEQLSREAHARITAFYARDYELLSEHYRPEDTTAGRAHAEPAEYRRACGQRSVP